MKKLVLLAVLLLLPALLSACNTIQGVGQDITAGGRAIDRAVSN
jgi:predicted small secreted protein